MTTVHVMLDLETLGLGDDAIITEIGLKAFLTEYPSTGFHLLDPRHPSIVFEVDVGSQVPHRKVEKNTIEWWINTNFDKFSSFMATKRSPADAVAKCIFAFFERLSTQYEDIVVWARDPDMDCRILGHFMQQHGYKVPWRYTMTRSHRTALAIAGTIHPRDAVTHSAGEDVELQITSLLKALRILVPNRFKGWPTP